MTTRKTILGASILLAVATVAGAAERTRSTDPTIANPTDTPVYSMVDSSSGTMVVNGVELTMNADGSVEYDVVMDTYGSLLNYTVQTELADVMRSTSADDTLVYANGTVATLEDFLPANDPTLPVVITIDGHKNDVQWAEQDFEGTNVTVFADGTVLNGMGDAPAWVQLRNTVPNTVDGDGMYIYANGAVVFDEPSINQ